MNVQSAEDIGQKSGPIAALRDVNDPNYGNTPQQAPQKRKSQVDDDEMEAVVKYVKKNRSSVVTLEAKLDIIMLQAKIRNLFASKVNLLYPGRKPTRCNATAMVSRLLNRKKELCGQVWADYVNEKELNEARPAANYSQNRITRVPHARCVINSVQAFVCDH